MRPTMSDEKKTAEPATYVITSSDNEKSVESSKSRPNRKLILIVGSVVLTLAIVLAAILVGMRLLTEAHKEIIKFSYNRNVDTKEDVTSDPNTNIVKYHAKTPYYEMWVVDDFNKDIQVMKIQSDSDTNCYVAPLNRSMATDPKKVSAPADKMPPNTSYTVAFRSAESPIPDSSFLSKTAKETCKGISTYWVYPTCKDVSKEVSRPEREKRRRLRCFPLCCCRYCIWRICAYACFC